MSRSDIGWLTCGVVLIVCGFSGAGASDHFTWIALADRATGILLGAGAFSFMERKR